LLCTITTRGYTTSHQISGEVLVTEFGFSRLCRDSNTGLHPLTCDGSSAKSLARGGVATSCDDDIELEKSNILLIGPTGSGIVCGHVIYGWTMVMFCADGFAFSV
jgi:hypothetical protein